MRTGLENSLSFEFISCRTNYRLPLPTNALVAGRLMILARIIERLLLLLLLLRITIITKLRLRWAKRVEELLLLWEGALESVIGFKNVQKCYTSVTFARCLSTYLLEETFISTIFIRQGWRGAVQRGFNIPAENSVMVASGLKSPLLRSSAGKNAERNKPQASPQDCSMRRNIDIRRVRTGESRNFFQVEGRRKGRRGGEGRVEIPKSIVTGWVIDSA